ncbi:MAG TPA: hypothetical protein VGM56_04900 [Byssovorax sp.]|jgi:hypothetical protein
MNAFRPVLLACVLATSVAALPGCFAMVQPLTAAEVAERGTRRFDGATREKTTEAIATSLTTLGYKVTVASPETGVVKTAPKTVFVSASAQGYGYSSTVAAEEDQIAWAIRVESTERGSLVHAVPRGYRNGTELTENDMSWVPAILDPKLRDIWNEVASTLGTASQAAQRVKTAAASEAGVSGTR